MTSFLCHASSPKFAVFFFSFHLVTCSFLSVLAPSYISCLYEFLIFFISIEYRKPLFTLSAFSLSLSSLF